MLGVEEGERALEMEDEASGHRRQVDSEAGKGEKMNYPQRLQKEHRLPTPQLEGF